MTHRDGFPRLSARSAWRGDAGHRKPRATPPESLGKPSLWVIISAPWYYPYTPPLQVTLRPGTAAFERDLIYNPRFVAWLMGWPPEWTSCELQVTGYARWLRRSRIALSELISEFETGLAPAVEPLDDPV